MISMNPSVRSFLSGLGAAVPVSIGWAWYKTTDKMEQFNRIEQGFAVLTGARIGYEFAKRGCYFTAVIIGTFSAVAIKQALEKSSVGTVRTLLSTAMIVAFAVEWFTKDRSQNAPQSTLKNLFTGKAPFRANSDYTQARVRSLDDTEEGEEESLVGDVPLPSVHDVR